MSTLEEGAKELAVTITAMRKAIGSNHHPAHIALAGALLALQSEAEIRVLYPDDWDDYVELRDAFTKLGALATESVVAKRRQ